jgi:hypothetical protein
MSGDIDGYVEGLERRVDELVAQNKLLVNKVITCGVVAEHPNKYLASREPYSGKWNSPQADKVRVLRAERDALRSRRCATCQHRHTDRHHLDYCRVWGSETIPEQVTGCSAHAEKEGA